MPATAKRATHRKELILNAARTLFLEHGYDRTTMRDIARVCDFESPNIYNYFRNKEQLLFEVIKDAHLRALSAIKPLENDDVTPPAEQISLLIKNSFAEVVGWTQTTRLAIDSELRHLKGSHRRKILALRSEYDRCLRNVIRRGIDANEFANADEKIVGFFITSLIIRSTLWFSPQGQYSADEIADMMFNFVLHGMKGAEKSAAQNTATQTAGKQHQQRQTENMV